VLATLGRTFGQTLERACARAGIPRCTPNDLRRTYSTWLRADGVPNELSAPTMGHKDTRMLDRVYARLPPELLRLRLLAALGRCSADAVNTSGEGAQRGRTGQPADDVTAGKLAPRAGIEPATHGLTVRGGKWPSPRDDDRMRHLRRPASAQVQQ